MKYQMCTKCVMDSTATEITFDESGICSFCKVAQRELEGIKSLVLPKIKGNNYDCLIGLSGGVDSSFALVKTIEMGLKPLAYTIDNGWNTPESDENIMRLVETLKVPFYRHSVDRKKFTELQNAFMKAGLRNLEIPTDHILMASSFEVASRYGIKTIVSGGNVVTESIMPASWGYNARDLTHIKDVYKKMTGKKLSGLPMCSLLKWNYYRWIKRIKTFYILDHVNYDRKKAIAYLEKNFGWKNYGDKHEESIFTKWFQNFYLYEKWGIDKRKAHYSSMINSGQMTREEALKKLGEAPVYPELGIEKKVMAYPKRSHYDFKTDEKLYLLISKVVRTCKSILTFKQA